MRSPARSRSKTQYAVLEEARRTRWKTPLLAVVQSDLQCAFAVIVNRGRHSKIERILSFLNIIIPGEKTYYRAHITGGQAIVKLVMESCGEWRENLAPDSVMVMDGSWSQRRNASHCVVDFINVASGKIVDFAILKNPTEFSNGNDFHSSDGMEVGSARHVAKRWREDQILNAKVMIYVHDCDGKTRKLLGKLWSSKQELLDPNHVIISSDKRLNNGHTLTEIKEKLRRYFIFILHINAPTQEKAKHWRNRLLHYQGIHHSCLNHPVINGPP
jgi:hypothetical protein